MTDSRSEAGGSTSRISRKRWNGVCIMNKAAKEICPVCGKQEASETRINRAYGKGKDLLVIENIPVLSCSNCGESYLAPQTLYELERIKLHRKSFASKRTVSVAEFSL